MSASRCGDEFLNLLPIDCNPRDYAHLAEVIESIAECEGDPRVFLREVAASIRHDTEGIN